MAMATVSAHTGLDTQNEDTDNFALGGDMITAPELSAVDPSKVVETHARLGPSLVFGGGGDFLSKYRHLSEPQRRAVKGAPNEMKTGARCLPDRAHVQVNTLLVHARSVDRILQIVEAHFDEFNNVNLITALHRLATVVLLHRRGVLRRDVRFKRIIGKLLETIRTGSLKPQDLSNIAWALTKVGLLNDVLFGHLSDHILQTIHEFEPVNLSMTLWAFARSGFLDERLCREASAQVKVQLPNFQPQQIANTTWAMAKSGFVDVDLFMSAAELALEKLHVFQPMNFSMLLYSFSLAKLPHPALFAEVGKLCTVKALTSASSAPHAITNLALAFSDRCMDQDFNHVFDALAQASCRTFHDFRTQQIAILTRAFARAQIQNEQLFAMISRVVVNRLGEFNNQDLQDIIAAYEALEVPTADILDAMASQAVDRTKFGSVHRRIFVVTAALALFVIFLLGSSWTQKVDV